MHESHILKAVAEQQLLPAGYALAVEEAHPDDFGRYFAVHSRGTHEYGPSPQSRFASSELAA